MKVLRHLPVALVLIFCFISLISFSWSAEKSKAPSSTVGLPALSAPAAGMLPVRPFSIKVHDIANMAYLVQGINYISLCALLEPGDNSQAAKEATVGKNVYFHIDGKPFGQAMTDTGGGACLGLTPNNFIQFQAGTYEIIAQARYGSSVIKGYSKLVVIKAESRFASIGLMPEKQTYKLGETVTYRGILERAATAANIPVANANVACTMRLYSVDNLGFVTSASAKTLFSVQTNSGGGFECPITLAPGLFDTVFKTQQCREEYLGASFNGNRNFNSSPHQDISIRVCP